MKILIVFIYLCNSPASLKLQTKANTSALMLFWGVQKLRQKNKYKTSLPTRPQFPGDLIALSFRMFS